MSLYNVLCGRNPHSGILFSILDITTGHDINVKYYPGRLRDIYPSETGDKIFIFTRNGRQRTENERNGIKNLSAHPLFRNGVIDSSGDYWTAEFEVPEHLQKAALHVADQIDTRPPLIRYEEVVKFLNPEGMEKIEVSDITHPAAVRALEFGKRCFAAIETIKNGEGPESGVIHLSNEMGDGVVVYACGVPDDPDQVGVALVDSDHEGDYPSGVIGTTIENGEECLFWKERFMIKLVSRHKSTAPDQHARQGPDLAPYLDQDMPPTQR